jgi:hypothetical protein
MRFRDHKAAYARRIAHGAEKGLSRPQSRGHPTAGQSYARGGAPNVTLDPNLELALKRIRKSGLSLADAATESRVGRERLSRYIKTVAGAHREGRAWRFNDQRIRRLAIVEAGVDQPSVVRVRGFQDAYIAGLHAHEAGQALLHPDRMPAFVRRWENARIRDVTGKWHTLSTDPNQLYSAILAQDYSFERFYRIEA